MKKTVLLAIGFVGLVSLGANAQTIQVTCNQAHENNVSRADSVAKIRYFVNLDKGTARLGCADPVEHEKFCGSMRIDGSKWINSGRLEKCNIKKGTDSIRQIYTFLLSQEDEFDNLVTLTVVKSCKTGQVQDAGRWRSSISAVISSNQSNDVPESAEVVSCAVVHD